jgi:hypothetical protein
MYGMAAALRAAMAETARTGTKVCIENVRTQEKTAVWVPHSSKLTKRDAEVLLMFGAALYAKGWNREEFSVYQIGEK